MRPWTRRQWLVALLGTVVTALVIGAPTAIVDTPFFTRMTPVLWWNYPIWVTSAVLTGLILATYVAPGKTAAQPTGGKRTVAGGLLSLLAVGCPVCNKLVVLALGVSGAFSYFAPIQPLLAVASVALLGYALRRRLQTLAACPMPSQADTAALSATPNAPVHDDSTGRPH